jgi:hypothetical protein
VSSLILEDRWAWDADLVRSVFPEDDAKKILQVPISRFGGEDFASWPHTRFGCYTVKSGYNLARICKFSELVVVNRLVLKVMRNCGRHCGLSKRLGK